jgi:hypothetical protein
VLTGQTTNQSFPSTLTNIKYNYPPPGTSSFSLGIQRELAPSVILQVQYAGSLGWDQNDDRAINTLPLANLDSNCTANPGSPYCDREEVANGTFNANGYRIFPGFSSIQQEENETNFSYNSFQAGVRMENRHGLTTEVAYTWGHNIDEVANDLSSLSNPFNAKYDRGSDTSFDRRHILNVNYVYNLPFFAHSSNLLAHEVLGGWTVSGITTAEKGVPLYVTYTGTDTLGLGGGDINNRPDLVSKVTYPRTVNAWFSKNSYADPLAPWAGGANQGWGTAPKDSVVGPGLFNWNLSLFKLIPLSHEGPRIELRFESFNTFNHTQFSGVDTGSHDSNFGQVTSDYGARTLQFGGKFQF